MLSTVRVTGQPAKQPVSRELAKLHCRIDHADDDPLIDGYIRAATRMTQAYLNRALITQTLTWTMTPEDPLRPSNSRLYGTLTLPRSPVQTIDAVTATDTLGNVTTIVAATLPVIPPGVLLGYKADLAHAPAKLVIGPDTLLVDGRTLRQTPLEHLQVEFTAGYGDDPADIEQSIIDGVLMTVAFLYEHRGDDVADLPQAIQWLLDPDRIIPV